MRSSWVSRVVSLALYAPLLFPCLPVHLTKAAQRNLRSQGNFGAPGGSLPDLNRAPGSKSDPPVVAAPLSPQESARAGASAISGVANEAQPPAANDGNPRGSSNIQSLTTKENSPRAVEAFNDVPVTNPFYAQIDIIKNLQVTLGCSANPPFYCPDDPVTREQMSAFIMRSLGEFNPPPPATQRFADVPPSNSFYNFIDRLAVLGITVGCGTDSQGHLIYCPIAPVTRGQMVTFLERAVGRGSPPTPAAQRFVDVPINHTFYSMIESFVQHGTARGAMNVFMQHCTATPDGLHFCPDQALTRAEMAALLVIEFGWMDGYTANARLDPINRTGQSGEDLFSGNCDWSLPLLGLPGRAGLDLGLSLSYNSLVWTKVSPAMIFNADNGFSPGFQLGFPIIQAKYSNSQAGSDAYMIVSPSGARVELRRVGMTTEYDSADSSYLRLDDNSSTLLLRPTDGTQLTYSPSSSPINNSISGDYRCTQIKDRNGNFLTINYHPSFGYITTIIDTLSRTVTFNYDNFGKLTSISQMWGNANHPWASFSYGSLTTHTKFCDPALGSCSSGISNMSVCGPPEGGTINVLTQLTFADGSKYIFDYTTWGQVWRSRHFAFDGHQLGYASYDLPVDATNPQSDCPRFVHRNDQAENWNNNAAAVTTYAFDRGSGSPGQAILPDNTTYKEFAAASGWQKGLPYQTEVWYSGVKKKWTTLALTQDNIGVSYPLNPRVTETIIYDESGNRRRTVIGYTSFGLPSDTYEYAADAATVLRRTHTDYNLASTYTDRRIIGLPGFQYMYDGNPGTLMSQVDYVYDNSSLLVATTSAPTQHDETNYGIGFLVGRGNLAKTHRYNVTNQASVEYKTQHDTAGSVTYTRDPLAHQTSFTYSDLFSDGINRNTFAYPTTVTDGDSKQSHAQYDYSMGAVRVATDSLGASRTTTYDSVGRVSRVDISNGAYTRYVYPESQTQVDSYSLILTNEYYSTQILDGAGRVRATASSFPGSIGGYRGQYTIYDVMGRVSQQSNPTEMNGAWTPTGDDQTTGWLYTRQDYDWKGRPTLSTNTDTTTRLLTYTGCGCAGGDVINGQDEVGRQQRMTYDVLGRLFKTEALNMDQSHSVYSTTTNTYNARDQLTNVSMQQGTNGTAQQTSMTYDGHGRLHSRKLPVEDTPGTVYAYYDDDTVQTVTDARNSHSTYTYNGRHLVTGLTYCIDAACTSSPQNPKQIDAIAPTPAVSFTYDDAGNRQSMTDGVGNVNYHYDTWSRLRWETRYFTDLAAASYTINYDYNLAGGLKQVIDPFNSTINYSFNDSGQVTGATATGFPGVSTFASGMRYRAWGALKQGSYQTSSNGNSYNVNASYNGRLQMTHFTKGAGQWDYQHSADGRVSFAGDLSNPTIFDRAYSFDHVGRLIQGLTGAEARGGTTPDGPFKQTYGYDVFDNMNSRHNRFWSQPDDPFTATYVSDRNTIWSYDAAGNIKFDTLNHKFDVMSRATRISDSIELFTIDQSYDGDGQPAKRIENRPGLNYAITTYYVRSSVLGGQVISELSASGINSGTHKTRVYLNGTEIAIYDSWVNQVLSTLTDPVIGQGLDPLGGYVGFTDPFVQNPNTTYDSLHPNEGLYLQDANPFDPGSGCELDGLPTDCSRLARQLENGTVGVYIGAAGKIGRVYDISNYQPGFGGGGMWVSMPTPSEPESFDDDQPGGPHLNVTDNAYEDVWMPFGGQQSGVALPSGHVTLQNVFGLQPALGPTMAIGPKYQYLITPLKESITNAAYRLRTKKDCAKLFGQLQKALETLYSGTYRLLDDPVKTTFKDGKFIPSVTGASTDSKTNTVFINLSGPFFNGPDLKTATYQSFKADLGTGLTGSDLAALIILHELGHQTKMWGKDAGLGDKDQNLEHSMAVFKACF